MRLFSRRRKVARSSRSLPIDRDAQELKDGLHEGNHPFSTKIGDEDRKPDSEELRHRVRQHRRGDTRNG